MLNFFSTDFIHYSNQNIYLVIKILENPEQSAVLGASLLNFNLRETFNQIVHNQIILIRS